MKQDWIVKVRSPERICIWLGTFQAAGRQEAKRVAIGFVAERLPLDTQILAIARGKVSVELQGDPIPFEDIQ